MVNGMAGPITESELVGLLDGVGRVLALPVVSEVDLPSFDNSAMDGYAIGGGVMAANDARSFWIAGRIPAGSDAPPSLAVGTAARIFTGAPIPQGCTAVVMQERCHVDGEFVAIDGKPSPGSNIRRKGEYVARGATLFSEGRVLAPQDVTLLAATGIAGIPVLRRVRAGILTTGDELIEPGAPLQHGRVYNSNRIMVQAVLRGLPWIECRDVGSVPDDRSLLRRAMSEALQDLDVLVTTGGVSAGEEDHVTDLLAELGGRWHGMKVAMRPGKPLKFGTLDSKLIFGLPGNPNAAFVTFRKFVLPALRVLAGANAQATIRRGLANFTYRKKLGRTEFVPVRAAAATAGDVPILEMLGVGSSADVSAMAWADGLAELHADAEVIRPGDTLEYDPF